MAEVKEITIDTEIGREGFSASDFFNDVKNNPNSEILLHINSGGGSLIDAFASYDYAKIKDITIPTVQITGLCGSAATIFSCLGNTTAIGEHSLFFIHNPSYGTEGEMNDDLQKMKNIILDIYEKKINTRKRSKVTSRAELSRLMDEETILNAEEALAIGFVDVIVGEVAIAAKAEKFINEIKQRSMKDANTKDESISLNALEKIIGFFNKKEETQEVKTVVLDLENELKLHVATDDDVIEGKKVFNADSEGKITDVHPEDGEHVLNDGKKITIKNGQIEKVMAENKGIEEILAQGLAGIKAQTEEGFKNTNEQISGLTARLDKIEGVENKTEQTEDEKAQAQADEIINKAKEEADAILNKANAGKATVVNKMDKSPDGKNPVTGWDKEPGVFKDFISRQTSLGYNMDKIKNREYKLN